jgi:hypothetical protein
VVPIKLSDKNKIELSITPNPAANIFQLLKDGGFQFDDLDFHAIANSSLADVKLPKLTLGAAFKHDGGASISIGFKAGMALVRHDAEVLFASDPLDNNVQVGERDAWMGLSFTGTIGTAMQDQQGRLSFGFATAADATLAIHKRFNASEPFGSSLTRTFEDFVEPVSFTRLRDLDESCIVTASGNGSFSVNGAFRVAFSPNPLASVDLPLGAGSLELNAGASAAVGVNCRFSGRYEIRARKLDRHRLELGFYREAGSEWGVSVDARAGLRGGVGNFDFIELLLKTVPKTGALDLAALRAAGLDDAQIGAISAAVKQGVNRKLEASIAASLGASHMTGRAFVYEIDLRQDIDTAAIDAALQHGDLTGFHEAAGITAVQTVFTSAEARTSALRINLLGIFNHISVTKLLSHSVVKTQANGDVLIADKATADRVGITMVHAGDDAKKIRRMLAESFLISAAYRCTGAVATDADLALTQTYFEADANTDKREFKDRMDVVQALDLITAAQKDAAVADFSAGVGSNLYASTSYGDALTRAIYLNADAARPEIWFEAAGRAAVLRLFEQSDEHGYLRHLGNDAVWATLKRSSVSGFAAALREEHGIVLPDPHLATLKAYYIVITWLAASMRSLAVELESLRGFLLNNPGVPASDQEFTRRRESLRKKMSGVARNAKSVFDEPWGLIAIYLALSEPLRAQAAAEVTVTAGDRVLEYRRELAAPARRFLP